MTLKHYYSSNIKVAMRNRRNNTRDGVMGIGAESYDNHTETPSKPETTTERLETQMPPSAHEEDDSEPEVVVISSSVISKRKLSIASTPGPRNKRAKTARALSDEPRLPDSESEGDSGEDESKYDDEEGAVDPKHQEKSAAASKEFNSACRTCKSNANKALKAKYDLEISKLKSEHKQELRELKADKAKILADTKKKAKKEMAMLKTKYEGLFEELKRHRDEKLEAWKDKHKKTTEEWQEKFDEEKKKVKKLTTQRDTAEAKRKEIERSAADDIKAAKEDLKAGERKLKEEKKQFMREKQDEIDLLKPQHSKALKEQDTIIKDMTQKVLTLEKDVQTGERTRDRIRNSHDIVLQRYQQLKTEHAEAQKHTKQVVKDLNDTKKYITGVDGRADLRLVRAEEKLGIQETNVREHANRVITLQRENYNLKDSVDQLAKLGREKRDEIERLKTELQSTKAELGVVKDMEEMSGGFE